MIAGSAMAMAAALWASAAGAIGGAAQPRQMGGVGITVYADAGFKGDNATFRSDQSDLGPSGFGNRISSLQVAAGEIWEVCANTEVPASLPGLLGNGNGPAPTQLERSDPLAPARSQPWRWLRSPAATPSRSVADALQRRSVPRLDSRHHRPDGLARLVQR